MCHVTDLGYVKESEICVMSQILGMSNRVKHVSCHRDKHRSLLQQAKPIHEDSAPQTRILAAAPCARMKHFYSAWRLHVISAPLLKTTLDKQSDNDSLRPGPTCKVVASYSDVDLSEQQEIRGLFREKVFQQIKHGCTADSASGYAAYAQQYLCDAQGFRWASTISKQLYIPDWDHMRFEWFESVHSCGLLRPLRSSKEAQKGLLAFLLDRNWVVRSRPARRTVTLSRVSKQCVREQLESYTLCRFQADAVTPFPIFPKRLPRKNPTLSKYKFLSKQKEQCSQTRHNSVKNQRKYEGRTRRRIANLLLHISLEIKSC
jgi:hypothetical protein